MKWLDDMSMILLVFAAIYLVRMLNDYLQGKKSAGAIILSFKKKPLNVDVILGVVFVALGSIDFINHNYLYSAMFACVAAWCFARGVVPISFHMNGLLADLEYNGWAELEGWTWSDRKYNELNLQFKGKRPFTIIVPQEKEELDAFLRGLKVTGEKPVE
jgi:hypothetical protein